VHGHKSCGPSRSLVYPSIHMCENPHLYNRLNRNNKRVRGVYRTSFRPAGVAVLSLRIHSFSALSLWKPDHPIRDSGPRSPGVHSHVPESGCTARGLRSISYRCCLRWSWREKKKLLMSPPTSTRRLSQLVETQGNARAGEYYLDMPRPVDLQPTNPDRDCVL